MLNLQTQEPKLVKMYEDKIPPQNMPNNYEFTRKRASGIETKLVVYFLLSSFML